MRILAAVTARGGSKRVPGKNIRLLGGRPLIVWSLDVVAGLPDICATLVSTDDRAIAEVARRAGALVPWLRPAELATDTAGSVDVCVHLLDWYEGVHGGVDGLLLLQPTSPFRRRASVERGLSMFAADPARPVVGFSPAASHPWHCFEIAGGRATPFLPAADLHRRSQEMPRAYVVNGAFYLIGAQRLRSSRSFYGDDLAPLIMDDPGEGLDIDTEWDWRVAEHAMQGQTEESA